jgi:DNA-binding GntR family transcriptional regulator
MSKIPKLTKSLPLNERAYRMLTELILNNTLQPGQMLVESALAKSLGISRSPLREALAKLENEGLIESVPGRGSRVRPLSVKYLAEVYEIRCALERLAARKAAPFIDRKDLAKMKRLLEEMKEALARQDLSSWGSNDIDLHQIFVDKADNDLLKEDIRKLRKHLFRTISFGNRFPAHLEAAQREHVAIYEAMKSGSPELLEEKVEEHVVRVGERLIEALERNGREGNLN